LSYFIFDHTYPQWKCKPEKSSGQSHLQFSQPRVVCDMQPASCSDEKLVFGIGSNAIFQVFLRNNAILLNSDECNPLLGVSVQMCAKLGSVRETVLHRTRIENTNQEKIDE
jgi:hypothetical protein